MTRILVALKRVVDHNVRIRVRDDGSGIAVEGARMSINPFDEIALEAALRLREQGCANEVVIVSVGPAECEQQLRTGLAMGADRSILVQDDADLSPLSVARVLRALIRRESPRIVLMGKQAIDSDNNQTGQMLAALWDRPQATFASSIEIRGDTARVAREVDAGIETIEIDLPAVITADLRLNEPRFVRLPDIMKAKRKPIAKLQLAELGVEPATGFRVVDTRPPEPRLKGVRVDDARALVAALRSRELI